MPALNDVQFQAASVIVPTSANVLCGSVSATATAGAATLITVPAGRTWVGSFTISCDTAVSAAGAVTGQAIGTVSMTGSLLAPSTAVIFNCRAIAGTNAAGGTAGAEGNKTMTVPGVAIIAAPTGSVIVQSSIFVAGSFGQVDILAVGALTPE